MTTNESSTRPTPAFTTSTSAADVDETRLVCASLSQSATSTTGSSISKEPTLHKIKPSTSQRQTDCDEHYLLLVVSILVLTHLGGWLLLAIMRATSMIVGLGTYLLLLLLEQDFVTFFGTGLILWIVFGGHRYLKTPSCLRPSIDSTPQQLVEDSSIKRGVKSTHGQQQVFINASSSVTLACSPIRIVCDSVPQPSQIDAPTKIESSIIEDINISSSASAKRSEQPKLSPLHNITIGDVIAGTFLSNVTFELKVADSGTIAPRGASIHNGVPLADTDIESLNHHGHSGMAKCPIAASTFTDVIAADEKKGNDVDQGIHLSSEETSDSHGSMSVSSSRSRGSTHTLPSSEEGGVDIESCVAVNTDAANIKSIDSDVERVVAARRPNIRAMIDLADLFVLIGIHGNPTFHEGPLDEVVDAAWIRCAQEANSIYNPGESTSDFTGFATFPDRPVHGDHKDISGMIEHLQLLLSPDDRHYLDNCDVVELSRRRDGMTGLNAFSQQLELLWHQQRPPMVDGTTIPVANLNIICMYEMLRTRQFRPAAPPGIEVSLDLNSPYRKYLTDEEAVRVNQGCVDYVTPEVHAYKCKTLRDLEQHPGHAGAKLGNPVLGWLDAMEGVEFYDAYAYLPCACGEKALNGHLRSRFEIEPGYNPNAYAFEVPKFSYLDDDAIEQDRQRKAEGGVYFGCRAGFPRSQEIAQECKLHAIPTNKPWILMEGFDDLNSALTGANNDLPVPGFTTLTKYPTGFSMAPGFQKINPEALPPRCMHGYLHPPFADHCMGCYPNGEQHDDCAECNAHDAMRAIKRNPTLEQQYEVAMSNADRAQLDHARKMKEQEDTHVANAEYTAHYAGYYRGWPAAVRT